MAKPKETDRVLSLLKQHRERLDQIEEYYHSGRLTAEQATNLLEKCQGEPTRPGLKPLFKKG